MSRRHSARTLGVIFSLSFVAGAVDAHEETLVPLGAEWRFVKGTQPPPEDWNLVGFSDLAWPVGVTGIGYGDGDDATVLDDMAGSYLTVYARRSFIADRDHVTNLVLEIDYDDGFIAYLNGVEVARRTLGDTGDPVGFETPAAGLHEAGVPETLDLTDRLPLLNDGVNVLAVEVHNESIDSSDLSFAPALRANVPVGPLPEGDFVPRGATWRFFKGTQAPPADWRVVEFDDSTWLEGEAGIGYGDGDDATVLDDMEDGYWAIFARRSFQVSDVARIETLVLDISYDDGFVSYLNGVEVARRSLGAPDSAVAFDAPASLHEIAGFEGVDLTGALPLLRTGENVLAFEVHNATLGSSDLSFHPELSFNAPPPQSGTPGGFSFETVGAGFQSPVAAAYAADGRLFVAEKRGRVHVVRDGEVLPDPFLSLEDEVNNAGDRGLLGMALHPDFDLNGYIYFLYVVDPQPGAPDENAQEVTIGRLTRYTAEGDRADPASRLVLLGNSAADGFPHCHSSHAIGTIRFGLDASLFVGSGDGAHFDFTDGGQDRTGFDPGCAEQFGSAQDVGALRSQDLDSLAGKILRVDPDTGLGYPDNPFYDGDAASTRSRVWMLGLRNPFRFTVQPGSAGPGALYIGDVGWGTWEELNAGEGGENFGWPCYEGESPQGSYQNDGQTSAGCEGLSEAEVTPGLISWHHSSAGSLGFTGNCASGAAFYTGDRYPEEYRGACFFTDYGESWLKVAFLDASGALAGIEDFASDLERPVDLVADPLTDDIVYVSLEAGEVRRLVYSQSNRPPVAAIAASPLAGPLPLEVSFSAEIDDPDGDPVTVEWSFGDGSPASSELSPVHVYESAGVFDVVLTVTDSSEAASTATVTIDAGNEPPQVSLEVPGPGARFFGGEVVRFRATAADPEDGALDAFLWQVHLHHEDHVHPEWFISSEPEPLFEFTSHGDAGELYFFEVTVTAEDSRGAPSTAAVEVRPGSILRGDVNSDGAVTIGDPVLALFHIFRGDVADCALAADADGNDSLEVADAVLLLLYLFDAGLPPSAPFPECDVVLNVGGIPCERGCP